MLWRTHAQTVRCVHSCPALYDNKVSRAVHGSAFEHIPYSVRGSAMTHVASARVCSILLSCARAKPDRYNWSRNGWKSSCRPYHAQRGVVVVLLLPASDNVAIGTKPLPTLLLILGHLLLCCAKHHPYSLLRDIHSYAFSMQPAIPPRSSEARVDHLELPSILYNLPQKLG